LLGLIRAYTYAGVISSGPWVLSIIGILIIGSLEAGIVAIGLTGFYVQFLYGLLITVSVSLYAVLLRRTV
jgi:uncharacterized membrane protein